ncbi:MAG: DUF2190 family protein [Planctomycetota bacterium]
MARLIKKHTQDNSLKWTNSSAAIIAGFGVVETGLAYGIAQAPIGVGATGAIVFGGIWEVGKQTGTALAAGARVGWDADNNRVSADLGTLFGEVVEDAAASATTVKVRLSLSKHELAGGRKFAVRRAVTGAEATANQVTIAAAETGGAGDIEIEHAYIRTASGALNTAGAAWGVPGDGTVVLSATAVASDDEVVVVGLAK